PKPRRCDPSREVAVAAESDARASSANFCHQLFVARTVEDDHDQVLHISIQPPCYVFQMVGNRRIHLDRVLTGWSDHNLFQVAVGAFSKPPRSDAGNTVIAPGPPVAQRLVPSSGSTAISTSGTSVPSGNSAPTFSPIYSMGASSRSPSPITIVPRIGIASMVLRMASVAT